MENLFEPVVKDRLYKGITDQIVNSILSGRMRPGDQLPTEAELAGQFGVSRTVVREAIKALSLQGLVNAIPGRGMFITHPPLETVAGNLRVMLRLEDQSFDDLIVARRFLEVPIARLAAENADAANLGALAAHLAAMGNSLRDLDLFIGHDTSFHAELARSSQNVVLAVLIHPLMAIMPAIRQMMVLNPDAAQRALDSHVRIYHAVVDRDGRAAEESMRSHLKQVAADIQRARQVGMS